MRHINFKKTQAGFSIVELMIAGLLGLLLIGGVIQLFLGSNRNYQMQDELSTIQEDGRFALMFLSDQFEMGGWTDPSQTQVVSAIDFVNSSDGANDSVAVSYVRAIDGVNNVDCNGNVVPSGVITNQFSVNADNELVCQGIGAGGFAQPLISNVESFQVLYGVETENVCPDGAVDRYMTRDEVNAAGLTANVMSVRVALLLASEDEVLNFEVNRAFNVADQTVNTNDRRVRRLFQETVFMPNSAFNILVNSNAAVRCMSGI